MPALQHRPAVHSGLRQPGRSAVVSLGGINVFAGQRAEAFFVDLGSVFDLGDLRPFATLHAGSG